MAELAQASVGQMQERLAKRPMTTSLPAELRRQAAAAVASVRLTNESAAQDTTEPPPMWPDDQDGPDDGPDEGKDDVLEKKTRGIPFNLLRDLIPQLWGMRHTAPSTTSSAASDPSGNPQEMARPAPPPDWALADFTRAISQPTGLDNVGVVSGNIPHPPLAAAANPMADYSNIREAFLQATFASAVRNVRESQTGPARPVAQHIANHSTEVWLQNGAIDPGTAVAHMISAGAAVYYFGRRASTLASQDSAVRGWLYFCETFQFRPWPATEMSLICFAMWSSTRIRPNSIRNYISAIRMRHKEEEVQAPKLEDMPRLLRVLDGLDWIFKAKVGKRIRLPCTLDVLLKVLQTKGAAEQALPTEQRSHLYSMNSTVTAAAVYCLAFVGALRPSEISVRRNDKKSYTSNALKLRDLQVFMKDGKPFSAILWLPKRKNDQMGEKSDVAIGRTGHDIVCAVQRVYEYLLLRQAAGEVLTDDSLLFPMGDASPNGLKHGLTYEELTKAMDSDLEAAGFDSKLYGGHSWRIGAATTLALNGVPEYMIKDIGGWSRSSSAFNVYFARAPQSLRASFSEFFSRPYSSTSGAPSNGVWVKMAEEIGRVASGLSPS
jgi:hypothetical protein